MRVLTLTPLVLLAACDGLPTDPVTGELLTPEDSTHDQGQWSDDPGYAEEVVEPLSNADRGLDWDNPQYEPGVDRWAPNGTPISIPLGSTNAFSVQDATYKGESANDKLGISVVSAGDLNGDGLNDMLMGSLYGSGTGSNDGAAYMNRAKYITGNARADASKGRFYGPSTSRAGEALGAGGDVGGDSGDDWIMGGRNWDHPTDTWKVNAGAAYVVVDFTRGNVTLPATGTYRFNGTKAYEFAGSSVDLGDVNGDGQADVMIGAYGADTNGSESGAVYLVYGPITADLDLGSADAEVGGEAAGDAAGSRVFGIGDYDGDGLDDWAVGLRGEDTNGTDAGAVYVITSSTAPTTLADADYILRGNTDGFEAGNAVHGTGDLDGDGNDDLLIGALGQTSLGAAYVISGGTASGKVGAVAQTKLTGQLSGDQFGSAVTSGDVSGDGTPDIIVAANRQGTTDRGAVYVFYGPTSGTLAATSADSKLVGVASNDHFGSAVAFSENSNQSGDGTLMVGASSRNSDNRGAVYLFQVP